MSLAAFLGTIARALHEAEIPFMLTGSLAAAFYGSARATQDIDLIIETQSEKLPRLVADLTSAGFYVDHEAALEALRTQRDRPFKRLESRPHYSESSAV